MVRFYKIIKLTVPVITTTNAIASIPASPTHTAKEQCRNIAIACHPRWKTTQEENATNHIIKRRIELLTSNTSPKRPITKQPTKTTTTKTSHNNPINKRHKKKKETQQERRIPLPKFTTPKQKNSLGWYHAIFKTPNLAINTAQKDLHDTTNKTSHNNHAGLQSVNNPSTIKITNYPPQTNANPKSNRNHDISNSKPPTSPEPRPNYQPPQSNAITVEDLPNHQA